MKNLFYLTGFFLAVACTGKKEESGELQEVIVPVNLTSVEFDTRTEPVVTAGMVTSLTEARLSFKVGGVIDKIYVREGEQVREGQLLATLDMTEVEAQVNQAGLALKKSERDFARVENMLRDTAATLEQFENAKTGLDVAIQNDLVARFNRDFARISSPVAGTIVRKLMSEGEVTGPGSPVFMLVANRKQDWVVRVGVSDRDWARLKPGDKASVLLDAYPGEDITGVVSFLSQVADPMTHLYDVELKLVSSVPRLASGLFAKVKIAPSGGKRYQLVPVEALLEGHGNDGFVFVAESGKAKKKPVKIGYLDGDKVLLTGGLDSTDKVITGGSAFLIDGSTIRVP